MELTLDPLDLKPEHLRSDGTPARPHPRLPAREVTFDKLTADAQGAVAAVGRGVYRSWERRTYNAVFPPPGYAERSPGTDTPDTVEPPSHDVIAAALGIRPGTAKKKRSGDRAVTVRELLTLAHATGLDLEPLAREFARRRERWQLMASAPKLPCPACDHPTHRAVPCELCDEEREDGDECWCGGTGWVWLESERPKMCRKCGARSRVRMLWPYAESGQADVVLVGAEGGRWASM